MTKKLLFTVAMLVLAVAAFAQGTDPQLPIASDSVQALAIGVAGLLITFGVGVLRVGLEQGSIKLPKIALYFSPIVLGSLIGVLAPVALLAGWKGVGAGIAAVALHQLKETLKKYGVNG